MHYSHGKREFANWRTSSCCLWTGHAQDYVGCIAQCEIIHLLVGHTSMPGFHLWAATHSASGSMIPLYRRRMHWQGQPGQIALRITEPYLKGHLPLFSLSKSAPAYHPTSGCPAPSGLQSSRLRPTGNIESSGTARAVAIVGGLEMIAVVTLAWLKVVRNAAETVPLWA